MMMQTDHYEILGVARDATAQEIRSAYRRLARIHHPDKGGDSQRFQEISAAYETLSDPKRRSRYNRGDDTALSGVSTAREIARLALEEYVLRQLRQLRKHATPMGVASGKGGAE